MAEGVSSTSRKLENQITCSVCLEQYTNPRTLPCHHSFCMNCIERLPSELKENNHFMRCPTCRQSTQLPDNGAIGFPSAFFINNLLEVATSLARHAVEEKDGPQQDVALQCQRHHRPMEVFCETCQELICHHCTFKDHRDHEYDSITILFDKHKKEMEAAHQHQEELIAAQGKLEDLNIEAETVKAQKARVDEAIDKWIGELYQSLEESRDNLKNVSSQNAQQMLTKISERKGELEVAISKVEGHRNHLACLLQTQSQENILKQKQRLMQFLDLSMKSLTKVIYMSRKESRYMWFEKNKDVLERDGDVGRVVGVLLERVIVSGRGSKSAIVGKKSFFDLRLKLNKGFIFPLNLISCKLCSPTGTTTCSINSVDKVLSEGDQKYLVSYTPSCRGPHQLKVTVGGIEMLDDSITIHVLPSPEMRGHLVCSISLPHKPYGLSLTKEGLVVVAMNRGDIPLVTEKGETVRSFKIPHCTKPVGVAVMRDNKHILVVDYYSCCLVKVTLEGNVVASIGSKGSGKLQFDEVNEIGVHPHTGQVFITDSGNHRVQVLNEDLTFSHTFGRKGKKEGQFLEPIDMAFDSDGMVYVTDSELGKIQKFTQKGRFISGYTHLGVYSICIDRYNVMYVNSQGYIKVSMYSTSGQLVHSFDIDSFYMSVCGMKVNHNGNLLISDYHNKCLLVF